MSHFDREYFKAILFDAVAPEGFVRTVQDILANGDFDGDFNGNFEGKFEGNFDGNFDGVIIVSLFSFNWSADKSR